MCQNRLHNLPDPQRGVRIYDEKRIFLPTLSQEQTFNDKKVENNGFKKCINFKKNTSSFMSNLWEADSMTMEHIFSCCFVSNENTWVRNFPTAYSSTPSLNKKWGKQKVSNWTAFQCKARTNGQLVPKQITCVKDSEALDMCPHHKRDDNKITVRHDQHVQFPV